MKKYISKSGMVEAYKHVLNTAYKAHTQTQRQEVKEINDKIENTYNEITKARKLLLKEEIDLKEIKQENENNIQVWEARLFEASKRTSNIEPILEKVFKVLGRLDQLYSEGDMKMKRTIIGSIYPEKLTFDGFQYRTTRINEAVRLIYLLDKGWHKKKTGETKVNFDLSCSVPRTGIEPAHCCQYQILSLARLPVPPSGRWAAGKAGRNITDLGWPGQMGIKIFYLYP